MRNRPIRFEVCLNEKEYEYLKELSNKTRLTKAQVVRFLILGCCPPEAPPVEYKRLIQKLRMIGNNINQLLRIARVNKILNMRELEKHLSELKAIEDELRDLFSLKKSEILW